MHCTAAREVSSDAAASGSRQQRAAVCGVRHNFQNYMHYGAETKERSCANQNTKESRRIQNTPTSKSIFLFVETPYMDPRAGSTRKLICLTYPVSSPQRIGAPPCRDRGWQNTCLDVSLVYVSRSSLSREQSRLVSRSLKSC